MQSLFFTGDEPHHGMFPLGICCWVEKTRQGYRWRRLDGADNVKRGGASGRSATCIGHIERIGYILIDRAGTSDGGSCPDDLIACRGHIAEGLDHDFVCI